MIDGELFGLSQASMTDCVLGGRIRCEVLPFLTVLARAAQQAGFELAVASGFRDFERQKWIWDAKASGERPLLDERGQPLDARQLTDRERMWAILRWSALPGASRHHWGTEVDVFDRSSLPAGETLWAASAGPPALGWRKPALAAPLPRFTNGWTVTSPVRRIPVFIGPTTGIAAGWPRNPGI